MLYYTKGRGNNQIFFKSNALHTIINRYIYIRLWKNKETRLLGAGWPMRTTQREVI